MIIDEIYSAALQGNHVQLETLLSRCQINLSQMYDAGTSGGVRTRLPLLFCVLRAMSRGRVDSRAISLLVQYGADINGFVLMESGGAAARLPFLAYAMMEWNSPELTDCLLQNGADPNGVREVIYPDSGQSAMPMLCLALQNPDAAFAELLLRNGADPNQQADVYFPAASCAQQLPPLYYALVEQRSEHKLSLLAAHGASPHFPISLSNRPEDHIPFKRYIQAAYPQLLPALGAAFPGASSYAASSAQAYAQPEQQAWSAPKKAPAPHAEYAADESADDMDMEWDEDYAPEKPDKKKKTPAAKPALNLNGLTASLKKRLPAKKTPSETTAKLAKAKQPAVQYDPNRRCYGKFTAYLFGNFSVLTLAFMIIAPLCFIGRDSEMALIFFSIGLPFFAICALLWWRVSSKAKRYGQSGVMVRFVLDSLLMFVRFMLMMLIVTIPLVKAIGNNIEWEERTTSSGRRVTVKKTGEDEYEDAFGNRYSGQ